MTENLKAEAQEAEVTFTFKDVEYKINTDLDVDVLEGFGEGDLIKATRALVDEDQYKTFKAGKPRMSDLEAFLQAAFDAMKVSVGESTA